MHVELSRWSEAQAAAIVARGQNVLVSAGAGSGKTSVLVERVVHCITGSNPVDLQRLLIVTFTEAAAAEMRSRIADRLQALYESAVRAENSDDIRLLAQQIGQVEQAQVSTLHSFCMQVVRRNFLFLNLEPVFDMIPEDDALLLRTELFQQLVEERLASPDADSFRHMLIRFGAANPQRLAPLVFRLDGFARSQPNPSDWLEGMAQRFQSAGAVTFTALPWHPAFVQWISHQLESALQSFQTGRDMAVGADELDKYADNLRLLAEHTEQSLQSLQAGSGLSDVSARLQGLLTEKSPRAKDHPLKDAVIQKRKAGLDAVKLVAEIVGRGEPALQADLVRLAPDVSQLVAFVQEFQSRYQAVKQSRAALDFNDLEHYALAALTKQDSGEARRLQEFYAEVFVDEYQDTSPIQDALVNAIAKPEGNVFVVGDVKQSIYRFRMAEPALFMNKYESLGTSAPGRVIDLLDNYRSRTEVVHAVNFVFEQLFSRDFGGIEYDERIQMRAGAEYGDDANANSLAGPVEVHLISRDGLGKDGSETWREDGGDGTEESDSPVTDTSAATDDELTAEDWTAIEKEALVIGQRIIELMGRAEGSVQHQVWDAKSKCYRPLQYRDIVILLRSVKTRMNPILEVLRKLDIPAYGATSTGFYGALEVQWLLSALSAVDNPRREIDLVALLRSPLGRFSDEDLARIRLAMRGNFYESLRALARNDKRLADDAKAAMWPASLVERVGAFVTRFQSWRTLARRATTEDVLRRLIDDTDYLYYVSGMSGGDVRQANVQVLLDKARAFDRVSIDGVHGFVTRAKDTLAHNVDVGEARALGEGEDVVRVMTIHQSKGLEYPVVIVADMGKTFHRDAEERLFPLHRGLGFGPQFYDAETDQRWPTVASLAIESFEWSEFLAEEARILYVAMTRARERLILVGSARKLDKLVARALEDAAAEGTELPVHVRLAAKTYLDWLLPTMVRHRDGSALRALADSSEKTVRISAVWDHPVRFSCTVWNLPGCRELPHLEAEGTVHRVNRDVLLRGDVGQLKESIQHLVETTGHAASLADAELQARAVIIETPDVVKTPGKVSATELRRLWVATHGGETVGRKPSFHHASAERLLEDPPFVNGGVVSGRESGIAFHTVMQHLDFNVEPTAEAVSSAINSLLAVGKLDEKQAQAVNVADVVGFLQSTLGRRLAAARRVFREQPFFHRIDVSGPNAAAVADARAGSQPFVIAQGVIDCLAEESDGWLLVDYKTDNILAVDAEAKASEYAAQIAAYLEVAQSIVANQTVEAYVYFVQPQVVVPMHKIDVRSLFG